MKLLVLSHMFPRRSGDWDGVFIHEQVAALCRRGIDARVLVGNPEGFSARRQLIPRVLRSYTRGSELPWQDVDGVKTAYFQYAAPYPPHWDKGGLFYAREAVRAARLVAPSFDFDLIHAHTSFLDGVAGIAIARRFRRKCVVTEHTGPFSTLTKTAIMRAQTGWALNNADLVIAVSTAEREEIRRRIRLRNPERIVVVGNGMRADIFRPDTTPRTPAGPVKALWVGGMHQVKQLPMLLAAYGQAQSERPQLQLTIAGDGPLSADVDSEIADRKLNVLRLPSQNRQQVADLIRSHDFLVVSSATESFSIIVIEAMGCGRPVLSTLCGGPEDTIASPQLGRLVENSASGLSAGLVAMVDDIDTFDRHWISGYAHAHYDIDAVAAKVEALLRTTLLGA